MCPVGSHSSSYAKTYRERRPSRKLGIDRKTIAERNTERSNPDPLRQAAYAPRLVPILNARRTAVPIRTKVLVTRSIRIAWTLLVRKNDWPKSNVTTF
jgi:hypothetical protein